MFDRNLEVFDQRILHGARDAGVKVDPAGAEDLAHGFARIGLGNDIVQVLDADAISEVREGPAVVGEEEVDLGHAQQDT